METTCWQSRDAPPDPRQSRRPSPIVLARVEPLLHPDRRSAIREPLLGGSMAIASRWMGFRDPGAGQTRRQADAVTASSFLEIPSDPSRLHEFQFAAFVEKQKHP